MRNIGFDDEQGFLQVLESACQQDEEAAFQTREAWTFDGAVEHDELLTEQKVFSEQLRFAAGVISKAADRWVISDRFGEVPDGRASCLHSALDDRLNLLPNAKHSVLLDVVLTQANSAVLSQHTWRQQSPQKLLQSYGCEG